MSGRVPVEATLAYCAPIWRGSGLQLASPEDGLTIATYVGNIYSASTSPGGAVGMLGSFEKHLLSQRGLSFKPSSKSVMPVAGCSESCEGE
eukprot:15453914-Alexandrium_andersonii.AAC.1